MTLEQRIEDGEVIILDGATGTELEKRGVPMDEATWCAAALATHPEVVRSVHEDYILAGRTSLLPTPSRRRSTSWRKLGSECGSGS